MDEVASVDKKSKLKTYQTKRLPKLAIAYVCDKSLLTESAKIPKIGHRAEMVASLIEAYNLLPLMKCIKPIPANDEELSVFHSLSYIECLKSVNEDCDLSDSVVTEFGLGYDCPPVSQLYKLVTLIAGATLTAARLLTSRQAQIAINWCGGWHHAQRDEAQGFCYVNDIVIGIEALREEFSRVLYIDLDIHHGDGVQNAYYFTKRVMTLSFHKLEPGFYPGTGEITEIGEGPGKYYCVNVPLLQGFADDNLCFLFDGILKEVKVRYQPKAVVLQCGADCLSGEAIGDFNLSPSSIGHCVKTILSWKIPTLILGGGGYNTANTARCWTYLTALICETTISDDIPDHPFFLEYGPAFDLEITPGNIPNMNTNIEEILLTVMGNLKNIDPGE